VAILVPLLLFVGFVAFVVAMFVPAIGRVNLIALGLAAWILTELLPHLGLH
jgi:hypothetical protein